MRLGHIALVVCAFTVVMAGAAAEGLAGGLSKGVVEVGVHNGFNRVSYSYEGDQIATTTDWELSFGVGKCLTDMLEIGGGLGVKHRGIDEDFYGSSSATAYGPRVFAILNFPTQGQIVPYLEAGMGFRFFSGDAYDNPEVGIVIPRVGGGFRLLVGQSASVNMGLSYQHVLNADGEDELSGNEFLMDVGVSLLL